MLKEFNKKLVLEDGSEYYGFAFGDNSEKVCELVFNTSMVGYQEIMSDLAYTDQIVVMTYPLIGNYGVTDDDFESRNPTLGGLVVREYNDSPSNFRYTKTLAEIMEENKIPGIYGLDTRKLTRHLRDRGTMKAIITCACVSKEEALEKIKNAEISKDAVARVSCKKRWYSRTAHAVYNVVAIDCGISLSMVRALNGLGCNVTVVPYNTSANEVENMKPDGVFISNGPGSPEDLPEVIELVKRLKGKFPIFGVSLGHGLISLAYGAKIKKLTYGHRGCNHPVREVSTGLIDMYAQNHSYVVDADSIGSTGLEITHVNVLDNTVEGVRCEKDNVYGIQFMSDTVKGPKSGDSFYDKFIKVMKEGKANA
jgi:carbamoyl-phosphate synthase small subunit